ncbi:FecR protein [Bremerella volcania]|uniref:FecR protein n=1 Tax=Bremerella volcania TaxID=2527984 RepID=A0A518C359_9BACT|nr:FecR domain-containing protein [Bremerella volcania]QDU73653.1 FecR protein [Bremerella volcania]
MSEDNNNNERQVSDLVAALIDGSMTDEQFNRLDQLLKEDPAARQLYLDALQIHEDLPEIAFSASESPLAELPTRSAGANAQRQSGVALWQSGLAVAILLPIAFLVGAMLPWRASPVAQNSLSRVENSRSMRQPKQVDGVQFANLSHARFFGEMPPKVFSSPIHQRDYVLMEGMVELAFQKGASAIIEGPAVFRVESNEKLALDIGRCSVHAPDGAEGFQVETPEVNVVDRGTRFSVHVLEDNATEVQVVEGAADIYGKEKSPKSDVDGELSGLRLNSTDARRFSHVGPQVAVAVPFQADQYKRHLPDRVVAYEATLSEDGRADELVRVQVQRGGKRYHYAVEDLIGSQVTHFHAQESHGYLIGDSQLPAVHGSFASDRSIRTGIINIGGSRQPLTESPNLAVDDEAGQFGTPGMAIRFDGPVKNGPGADVVFFELQMFSNPLVGDAFHVSPLEFRDGLHSHTITSYDLTLESPEALQVRTLFLQKFEQVPRSLTQLEAFPSTPVVQAVKFHAIAVGIDLSDLGYEEGALVDGLFFQDALNDDDIVDPTFIAGLPEVES